MIIDSYAWIELFKATENGNKVAGYITNGDCYTLTTSIAEIVEWCLKANFDVNYIINKITILTAILDVDRKAAFFAGELNFQRKKTIKNWGMMDSVLLATALLNNLKILTGDKHFSDLPNVEMI